jgi:hypothetical protein
MSPSGTSPPHLVMTVVACGLADRGGRDRSCADRVLA